MNRQREETGTGRNAIGASGGRHHPLVVAALLFVSGGCALTYQITWLRLLRLVFGYSTAASAAALAIFMGGLGLGAIILGRRADSHPEPLKFYAKLELGIAACAALTPFLLAAVRSIYTASGGSAQLGLGPATALRLVLSAAVLAAPTFLMGGTLSAAARAVEVTGEHRWRTALLYGGNTLGAVSGVLLANFLLLEFLGTRFTLLLAAATNGLIAWLAFTLARPVAPSPLAAVAQPIVEPERGLRIFVLAGAAIAGFSFLLMEIVWYRMLAPLLGGSTYTFGIILAVALAGVGLGGLLYAVEARKTEGFGAGRLALVSALEAVCCMIPFALGDRIALLAMRLSGTADGVIELMSIWILIAGIVIFPMALVSGYQFPLFIALAGARAEHVGADVGRVYALNTIGAIAGSLAGGFGVLPGIGALGAWRLAAVALSLFALCGACIAWRRQEGIGWIASAAVAAAMTVILCWTQGPTAVWRHLPIGVVGMSAALGTTPNEETKYLRGVRRGVYWEEDGVESTVAITESDAFSLMINGKSDGNAIGDVSTMIMIGALPAIFHEAPQRVLVIGLGLGTTAGWLATLPSVERVDVVELEPAVLRAARDMATTNFGVMNNPKVNVVIGDAREFLLTTKNRYDIIVSEPSNPYRAGVASLFTIEFYEAAKAALAPGGAFAQWLQAYAVDMPVVRSVYATVATVFPSVESWEVHLANDLLLLAREEDVPHDLGRLRQRLATEPYRTGLELAWGVAGLEGLYSGFLGSAEMGRHIRAGERSSRLNTDDATLIEFECARSVLYPDQKLIPSLRELVMRNPQFAPPLTNGEIELPAVAEARVARALHERRQFNIAGYGGDAHGVARMEARDAYARKKLAEAAAAWGRQPAAPVHPIDTLLLAESLAVTGNPAAVPLAEKIRRTSPGDAESILAFYKAASEDFAGATASLVQAFNHFRAVAWGFIPLRERAVYLAWGLARSDPESARALLEAMAQPFAVHVIEDRRYLTYLAIALDKGPKERCGEALEPAEPWFPWVESYLRGRLECYERVGGPHLQRARDDLAEFLQTAPAKPVQPGA